MTKQSQHPEHGAGTDGQLPARLGESLNKKPAGKSDLVESNCLALAGMGKSGGVMT